MGKTFREWTHEERERLFDTYFSPLPGICPVCSHEVCMVMSYLGSTVKLLFSCDGCGNRAEVNRTPLWETNVRRTDEDESRWA